MNFTKQDILRIAMAQSAIDANCAPEDFTRTENVVTASAANPDARRYLTLPFDCELISYGNNIVASVGEDCRAAVEEYIGRFPAFRCFETPNLLILNDALQAKGLRVCFMAEYFLPDLDLLRLLSCPFELRLLHQADFDGLYTPQWSNALCEARRELDVLGVGAYDGGTLVGLAGCSADCETMWQIGVDVLPAYRRQGAASALTSRLALEILDRGRVPFYCAAWSNLKSVRNAIKSGFRPAWVELTAKSASFAAQLTGGK